MSLFLNTLDASYPPKFYFRIALYRFYQDHIAQNGYLQRIRPPSPAHKRSIYIRQLSINDSPEAWFFQITVNNNGTHKYFRIILFLRIKLTTFAAGLIHRFPQPWSDNLATRVCTLRYSLLEVYCNKPFIPDDDDVTLYFPDIVLTERGWGWVMLCKK